MDNQTSKKLYRRRDDRVIAGVCSGLAKYFDLDAWLVRVIFLVLVLFNGVGLILYLLLAIIIPLEPGPTPITPQEEVREIVQETKTHISQMAGEMRAPGFWESRRNLIGVVVVATGIFILLKAIYPYPWFRWEYFWSTLIILAGLVIIFRK